MRRNSTSGPATPASRCGRGRSARRSASACAGTNGIPKTARAMMLMGADILFYPTAIGTEPHDPDLDTSRLWRRAMIGHAVSNVVPVVAANRIGTEHGQRFYGHSFICDERGDILAEFGAEETGVLVATLDLAAAKKHRAAFGFFRDRRPELYGGSPRTSERERPLEHAFEHRRVEAARCSGCSASSDSSTAGCGRPARRSRAMRRIWSMPAAGRAPAPPRHARSGPARPVPAPSAAQPAPPRR